MALQIAKAGDRIKVDQSSNNNKVLALALGWDSSPLSGGLKGLFGRAKSVIQSGGSTNIDCDASAALLDSNNKVLEIVSFRCLESYNGAVWHSGDNLTGEDQNGIKDDEVIFIDTSKLPQNVHRVLPVVNIFSGNSRGQHFGMIGNAYVRLVDASGINFSSGKRSISVMKQVSAAPELIQFNLTRKYDGCLGIVVADIYRSAGGFEFHAIGEGTKDTSLVDTVHSGLRML